MSKASTTRQVRARQEAHRLASIEYLAQAGFEIGQRIKVDGEGGAIFTIEGAGSDGSISCNQLDNGSFRSFRPEWCYPSTRVNRRGKTVSNPLPPEVKGRRAAWRAEHGFASLSEPGPTAEPGE